MLTTNARDAVLGWMSTFTLNIDYVFRSLTAEFKTSCCPPQADFFRFLGTSTIENNHVTARINISSTEFKELVEKITKKNMFKPYPNINVIPN